MRVSRLTDGLAFGGNGTPLLDLQQRYARTSRPTASTGLTLQQLAEPPRLSGNSLAGTGLALDLEAGQNPEAVRLV